MNDIKVCLTTNWWQLGFTLKTMADQQSAWGSLRKGSLWLYSVWDNTLITVLVALQQSTSTLKAGGNALLHSAGSPFLPDKPQLTQLTVHRLQYAFCGKSISIRVYAIANTHWVFCFIHPHRPKTAWQRSHKANKFSCATLYAACENHATKLHKPIFSCHNLACKPPQNACMRTTLGHFQTARLQINSGQTELI